MTQEGDLVVHGDVATRCKSYILKFCNLLPLTVKKFSNLLPLRVVKIDMIRSRRFKKVDELIVVSKILCYYNVTTEINKFFSKHIKTNCY